MHRCQFFIRHDRTKEALADANAALKRKPENARLFMLRGRVHGRMEAWDKAVEDATIAISLEPKNWVGYEERSYLLAEQGRCDCYGDFRRVLTKSSAARAPASVHLVSGWNSPHHKRKAH
jgi:tetratricopeptide (TPR) repeat protein